MEMDKKYIVVGGWVISKQDGDRHYINASKLIELYQLDRNECYLMEEKDETIKSVGIDKDAIILRPRYDGDYILHLRDEIMVYIKDPNEYFKKTHLGEWPIEEGKDE